MALEIRIRDLKMKKIFVILVAVMAIATNISAQCSDTTKVKLSGLKQYR